MLQVSLSSSMMSPNGDGIGDTIVISAYVNFSAIIEMHLQDENGASFTYRSPALVPGGQRSFTFVFDALIEETSTTVDCVGHNRVYRRVLPDGKYTWSITAQGTRSFMEGVTATGQLEIVEADSIPPLICGFSVHPSIFTPNQDGIDDRATVNLVLNKDVASLRVYLEGSETNISYPIPWAEGLSLPREKGWHTFDYDGGIDNGIAPPADGVYTLVAEAIDYIGQVTQVTSTIEIRDAGLPRAYIQRAEVNYSQLQVAIGESLCYSLTVKNESRTPLRTVGPWAGTIYGSEENFNALGWAEESGAFRIGLDYEGSLRNYPYRWGIGRPGIDLIQVGQHWYLPAYASAIVTGCVRIETAPSRNPRYYWTGLIHEDVEILPANDRVNPQPVTILERW